MLFNSMNFAVFLPIVFVFYWFVTKKKLKSSKPTAFDCELFFLCVVGFEVFVPFGFHFFPKLFNRTNNLQIWTQKDKEILVDFRNNSKYWSAVIFQICWFFYWQLYSFVFYHWLLLTETDFKYNSTARHQFLRFFVTQLYNWYLSKQTCSLWQYCRCIVDP